MLSEVVSKLEQFDSADYAITRNRDGLVYELILADLVFHGCLRKVGLDVWLEIVGEVSEARFQFMRFASLQAQGCSLSQLEIISI